MSREGCDAASCRLLFVFFLCYLFQVLCLLFAFFLCYLFQVLCLLFVFFLCYLFQILCLFFFKTAAA